MTPGAARAALAVAALLLLSIVGAGLSPLGDGAARSLKDKPIVRSLDQAVRTAPLESGFRLHTDPEGRFSVGIPPGYELDMAEPTSWRYAGPVVRGLPTFILVDAGDGAKDLEELDGARDRRYDASNLAYMKLASDQGELDGRPALNRAIMLGAYRGWEVVSLDGTTWVSLTLLCHEEGFFEHEVAFRKVLASFRLPLRSPGGSE